MKYSKKWDYDNFKLIKDNLHDYLRIMGSNVARYMMINGTLPLGASQKNGKYKKGEKTLRKDISKSMNSIQQAAWRISSLSNKKSKQFAKVMFNNPTAKQQQSMVNMASKLGVNLKITQFSNSLHTYNMTEYSNNLILNNHAIEKYKVEKTDDIGRAKSGWVGSASDPWMRKRQKWIRRHGINGSFRCSKNRCVIRNNVRYATNAVINGAAQKAYSNSIAYAKRLVDNNIKKIK